MDLKIKKWKKFKVKDVLTREPIKSISSILKSQKSGDINVVGNSSLNNGVINKISLNDKSYLQKKNTLSYGAKGGKFFWQKEEWVSTDHVHQFSSPSLNENNQLFLCTILNYLLSIKGGWSSSLESNIVDEDIYLPVNEEENPDWKFMDEYIQYIKERERESSKLLWNKKINYKYDFKFNNFKIFKINKLLLVF